ncbi:Hypothetical protein POVN_LOCUS507 [uncultured virus]|nr:Hypothetical protein POVN_LOCUS507 [uncultured virus]
MTAINFKKKEQIKGSFDAYCEYHIYHNVGVEHKERKVTLIKHGGGKYTRKLNLVLPIPQFILDVVSVETTVELHEEITFSAGKLTSVIKSPKAWEAYLLFTETLTCRPTKEGVEYELHVTGTNKLPAAIKGLVENYYTSSRVDQFRGDIGRTAAPSHDGLEIPQ